MEQQPLKAQASLVRSLSLPEHGHIDRERTRILSEADYYGASYIIASLLGKKRCPRSFCTWKHGWGGFQPLKYPGQLISDTSLKGQNHLVHTQAQAEFLQRKGFRNAFAVGMPFAYAWRFFEGPARKRGTLLVMPPHMSKYINVCYYEEDYLNAIQEISSGFSDVAVCITAACDEHGRWRSASESLGFKVITGGDVFDRNSLLRMLSLFSEYEFVTTPQLGSHIAYASLCGCRVSVYSQVDIPTKEAYLTEPYYQRYPEILDLIYSPEAQDLRAHIASQFRSHPSDAKSHVDWAKEQTGVDSLRYLGDLAKLLGWNTQTRIRLIPDITKRLMQRISGSLFT